MDINRQFSLKDLQEVFEKHKDSIKVVQKMELRVSPRFWEEELKPQLQIPAYQVFTHTNPFGINILLDDEVETFEFREVQP